MGIVERKLADFELTDGTSYRIELNRNGRIHIHIDTIRIDMTAEEFAYFTEIVSEAKDNIVAIKNIQS